jgi:uracil DNA glycosylase
MNFDTSVKVKSEAEVIIAPMTSDEIRTVGRVRQAVRDSINRYIALVENCVMQSIDTKIKRYLMLIPEFVPISVFILGQEPYSAKILPPIAAAFAYDFSKTSLIPPSLDVLVQYLHTKLGRDEAELLSLFGNSAILLDSGVASINVYQHQVMSDKQRIEAFSYFTDMITDVVTASKILQPGIKFEFICFGDIAYRLVRMLRSSLNTDVKKMLSLRTHRLLHPVFVSRTFEGETVLADSALFTKALSVQCALTEELDNRVQNLSKLSSARTVYHKGAVNIIGEGRLLNKILTSRIRDPSDQIAARFIKTAKSLAHISNIGTNQELEDELEFMASNVRKFKTVEQAKEERAENFRRSQLDVLNGT